MAKKSVKKSLKNSNKLKKLVEKYIKHIETKGDECMNKRIVNKKIKHLHGSDYAEELIKSVIMSADNTLNNEMPRNKLDEFCGAETSKMLDEINSEFKKSIKMMFGKKKNSKHSQKHSKKSMKIGKSLFDYDF